MKTRFWLPILGCVAVAYAATTLTINDVVKLSKAGISDDVIIQTLQSSKSAFQLTPKDIETLTYNGVSDHVIVAMMVKGPDASRSTNLAPSTATSVPRPIVSDYTNEPPRPSVNSGQNPVPYVAPSSSYDYYGGTANQPVVKALPASPEVYYYSTPSPSYYYYPDYYYAPSPYYYYGPSVGFYFGRSWGGSCYGWGGHSYGWRGYGGHGGGHGGYGGRGYHHRR